MSGESSPNESWMSDNRERANQVINKYTGKTTTTTNKRKSAPIVKDDDEYHKKRQRNNVAVKKSREKAKNRIQETQVRVDQLSKENEELQSKVTLLSKELNVLRALFTNGGFTLPCELPYGNNNSTTPSEHSPSMSYSPHSRISSEESSISQPSPHHPYDSEKSYHSMDDTKMSSKIPPLRPMPRIPSSSSSHKHASSILPIKSYSDRMYNIPSKNDYIQKDSKVSNSGPPLLIQPQSLAANIHSSHSQHKGDKGDTRHPSVIRSTTDVNDSNTLGKFCIIQDTQGDKQIKIVPITS